MLTILGLELSDVERVLLLNLTWHNFTTSSQEEANKSQMQLLTGRTRTLQL